MKKLKELFIKDNLPIIIVSCIIIIAVIALIWYYVGPKKAETVAEITYEEAISKAVTVFQDQGELNVDSKSFEVLKTSRDGIEYYYISSKENTVEIAIKGGKVNRINSVIVQNDY